MAISTVVVNSILPVGKERQSWYHTTGYLTVWDRLSGMPAED